MRILRLCIMSLMLSLTIGETHAGLDRDTEDDKTIAVYHFEDLKDSGPRGFDLSFPVGVPRFERGKIGKTLAINVLEGVCI